MKKTVKTKKPRKRAAAKAADAGRPSAVQVKHWAIKYETMDACEAGEGLTQPLRPLMRFKTIQSAWERGQLLRQLKQFGGETNFTVEEAGRELGFEPGGLEAVMEQDAEAAETFNAARIATIVAIQKVQIDQAKSGSMTPTTARQLAAILKREVAKKSVDFERLTTDQMSELFGVSRVTLNDWLTKYDAPRNCDKSYNLKVFLTWFAEYQVAKIQRQPGKYLAGSEDEATRLRNKKIQMQIDEFEKRLVPADRAMGSLLARAAAIDKFLAAHGSNLYLKIAGLPEEQIQEKLSQFFDGIRQAACSAPPNFMEMLPEDLASAFAEILAKLSAGGRGGS